MAQNIFVDCGSPSVFLCQWIWDSRNFGDEFWFCPCRSVACRTWCWSQEEDLIRPKSFVRSAHAAYHSRNTFKEGCCKDGDGDAQTISSFLCQVHFHCNWWSGRWPKFGTYECSSAVRIRRSAYPPNVTVTFEFSRQLWTNVKLIMEHWHGQVMTSGQSIPRTRLVRSDAVGGCGCLGCIACLAPQPNRIQTVGKSNVRFKSFDLFVKSHPRNAV